LTIIFQKNEKFNILLTLDQKIGTFDRSIYISGLTIHQRTIISGGEFLGI
tara:strand:- start:2179 stop:2328 length:150 start_codon:yes stop_codon:yes gene_type:complete